MIDNFLLACYKGYCAQIWFYKDKWIGCGMAKDDRSFCFDGKTIEEILETFHSGVEEMIRQGILPLPSANQLLTHVFDDINVDEIYQTLEEKK